MKKLDTLIEKAASAATGHQRRDIAAKARGAFNRKAVMGRPTRFNEEIAETIIGSLSEGKTLTRICRELDVNPHQVYCWLRENPSFNEKYLVAKTDFAASLVDEMVEEAKESDTEKALLLKVKAQIYQWTAQRYNPKEFSDSRRIELKGEVNHRHVHELSDAQKQRIAESWLLSQSPDNHLIEHEPIDEIPAIESGVSVIEEPNEKPKKKKALSSPVKRKREADDW